MIGASYLFRKCAPAASGEAIYVKMIVKKPGLTIAKEMSEMDLVSNSGEYSSADCGC